MLADEAEFVLPSWTVRGAGRELSSQLPSPSTSSSRSLGLEPALTDPPSDLCHSVTSSACWRSRN